MNAIAILATPLKSWTKYMINKNKLKFEKHTKYKS